MIITFHEVWWFIETTHVDKTVLELIHPETGNKISPDTYIIKTHCENRYNMDALRTLWEDGYSFIVHGSQITPNVKNLVEEVESDHNVDAQSHIYMGKKNSRSFPTHADNPDNLIVQCIGKSKVTIYNEYSDQSGPCRDTTNLTIKEQYVLEPGNSIYIPSLQFHHFEPLTDRLSISIPMYKK